MVGDISTFLNPAISDGKSVQHTINEEFMVRAVQYCLNVYQQFKEFPVLVVFGVKGFASRSYATKFDTHPRLSYCLQTPCNYFAKDVAIVTHESIKEELKKGTLLPIPVLANFFT